MHLLDDLASVLLTLQLSLRRHNRFDEVTFRRILELKIQALTLSVSRCHFTLQTKVKLSISTISLQIIEQNGEAFKWMRIKKCQQRNHTRTFHKITAS
ncbi:MAG TPA: hypothetical protein DCS30_14040 [Rhizobiales bacterium]|nr:hypothetical protein [Hyphomicrobiales bacterium]